MVPTAYVATGETTSPKWCAAFATGCGGGTVADRLLRPGPVALFGSPKLWSLLGQARAEGRDWYYGDHGYFRRHRYYRVTRGAYQHAGLSELPRGGRRFQALDIPIRDWRKTGGHILLCPPDQAFARLHGFRASAWRSNILAELRRHTDRPIVVRERHDEGPLSADLAGAWALVTYVSNAAVEAIVAGVPVFCTGDCAGRAMGSGDLSLIERPRMPGDREAWAETLAGNQWTLDEIARGDCWEALEMARETRRKWPRIRVSTLTGPPSHRVAPTQRAVT